jgi:hypothetical protein
MTWLLVALAAYWIAIGVFAWDMRGRYPDWPLIPTAGRVGWWCASSLYGRLGAGRRMRSMRGSESPADTSPPSLLDGPSLRVPDMPGLTALSLIRIRT